MDRYRRLLAWACVFVLAVSTLPLYAISVFTHPYYDDFGFSIKVHQAWQETGSMTAVMKAAVESARNTRRTWQGTYTGTFLSNLQPGLFSEELYWIANVFLLTAFIAGFAYFFAVVFVRLGLDRHDRIALSCLSLTLMIQFMPDVGEAFFWFNGGVGNVFIYSLIALAAALCLKLYAAKGAGAGLTAALAVLAVLLGGGSYGGGLFVACTAACLLMWLHIGKHKKRWHFTGLTVLFACCFLYSMTAPGNSVRADMIGYRGSAVKTVLRAVYYGVGQMGQYIRLPLIAVTLMVLPAFCRAAKNSAFRFDHPWLTLGMLGGLYCTQLAPPLYSIASIGAGRIVNTYFISFVALWFLYVYYLAGFFARRVQRWPELTPRRFGALLLTAVCLLGVGCLGFKRSGDGLYGIQNLSGPSAALSILTGEAQQYDREMTQREQLLNDDSQLQVTLGAITSTPAVFMDDLLQPGLEYDIRPIIKMYYGKEAILLEGEADVP